MLQLFGAIFIAVVTPILIKKSEKWVDKLEEKFFGKDDKKEEKE